MNIEPIAYIHTDFDEKFGIPRQSGRVRSLTGRIVFVPEYRKPEALRGIDGFSHLWLLFDFSLVGTREGTIISALLTGTFVKFFTRILSDPLNHIISEK